MQKNIGEVLEPMRLEILVLKSLFCMQNRRSGLGSIETSHSDANHVVLHAQNDKWGLGPMETNNSGANHAVLHAQSDRWGLGPIETINSGHNVAVLNAKKK